MHHHHFHHYHRPYIPPTPPPPPHFSSPSSSDPSDHIPPLPRGKPDLLGPGIVISVALVVLYFVAIRPRWYSDVTAPPGKFSGQSGGLSLTVTKVETSSSRFRVWMTATNKTSESLRLPIFGYFHVKDDSGRKYEANPFSSTFPSDVPRGATVSGYAEIRKPLASGTRRLEVGFSTVFGSFAVNSIWVEGIALR